MKFDLVYEQTMQSLLFEQEGITAIYPGGFKPPHKGHYELAKTYAEDSEVKEVKIMLGPKTRSSDDNTITVTEQMSKRIWEDYYIPNLPGNKVTIEASPDPVPVRAAYVYVDKHTNQGDVVALMSSIKSPADAKRAKEFAEKHGENFGKYHKPGVVVLYHPKNTVAKYDGRTDGLDGENVSASQMREDAAFEDLDNFKTNLPDELQDKAKEILEIIRKK